MSDSFEILSLDQIQSELKSRLIGRSSTPNELHDVIDSTNNRAAELARNDAGEGVIVLARQQTGGRGRLGRTWVSPPDSGIYLSVLLKPPAESLAQPGLYTLATGTAVAGAVENVAGVRLGLKWVNDLVFEGKKVGGILAEFPMGWTGANGGSGRYLVLGIGLNVRLSQEALPEELKERVTWLEALTGMPVNPNMLVAQIALQLEHAYDILRNDGDRASSRIIDEWKKRTVTLGREVQVTSGNTAFRGTATDIDASGALLVRNADGSIRAVHAGEVTVRLTDGSYV